MSSPRFARILPATLLLVAVVAAAQDYPERPVTLVAPWAVGTPLDGAGRVMSYLLQKELGKPVNIVNRPAGSGASGYASIAAAAPDGYTLGFLTADAIRLQRDTGFTPIALFSADPAAVIVRSDSRFGSVHELLAAARASPGRLGASLFPEDPAAALRQLLAGTLDLVACAPGEAGRFLAGGQARQLAGSWDALGWRALGGPSGLPPQARERLLTALRDVHAGEDFRAALAQRGLGLAWAGPEETAQRMARAGEEIRAFRQVALPGN